MKGSRRPIRISPSQIERIQVQPQIYAFYEKRTGTTHFRVHAGPGGRLPVDHAAALLAMHCLVRGQSPADYAVMIEAGNKLTDGLKSRAEALLEAGRLVAAPTSLSRREQEVLRAVIQGQANKEIAAALNLSERTVKFHVSSLLAKFRVRNRMELTREAGRVMMSARYASAIAPDIVPANGGPIPSHAHPGSIVQRSLQKGEVVSMRGRQMTA